MSTPKYKDEHVRRCAAQRQILAELNMLSSELKARGILPGLGHVELAFAYGICQRFGKASAWYYIAEVLRLREEQGL